VAAGLMGLLIYTDVSSLMSGDEIATSAWREGCGPRNMALTVFCGVALIVVGRWARGYHDR
jgi:hypothetical protein